MESESNQVRKMTETVKQIIARMEALLSTEERIKESVLEHWEQMIRWAEKQPPRNPADSEEMEIEIKQGWGGQYCAYC